MFGLGLMELLILVVLGGAVVGVIVYLSSGKQGD